MRDDLGAGVAAVIILTTAILLGWAVSWLTGVPLCSYQAHLWGWC